MKKLLIICIISILAFVNATYLTIHNYQIEKMDKSNLSSSFCDINNIFSCTSVLSSPYSKVFWLPFPAIAMIVYPLIFVIALLGLNSAIKKPFHILAFFGLWWTMFNWYFISQEIIYIWAFCPLCLLCTAMIITILIISLIWIFGDNTIINPNNSDQL